MAHEAPLQHPLEPLQSRQLPPLVDPHGARIVYPHHHPGPVPFPRLVIDGVLIPRPAGGIFDRIENVSKVGAQGFAVRFAEVVGADRSDGLEGEDQLVRAAVGGVKANELGDAWRFVRVGHDFAVRVISQAVLVRVDLAEGFFEEQGDVFAGCYLDGGEGGGDLFGKGFDCVLRLGRHVVDEGAEESPLFERGCYRLGLVGCGDDVSIAGYDFEEVFHVFEDFVVGGATVEGTGAEGMDGSCFGGGGGRMRERAFEGSRRGFVYQI